MNNQESRDNQEYQYRLQMIPVLIGLKELEHCLNFADDNYSLQTYILSNENNATLREDGGLRLLQFLIPSADILKDSQASSYPLLFQTDDGEECLFIKKIEITSLVESEVEHYKLNILLDNTKATEDEVNNINNTLQKNGFAIKKDKYGAEKTLVIIYQNGKETNNTIMDIEFDLNDSKKRKIQLCLCKDTHISDVVLDCGSESTQYLRYDRGTDKLIDYDNIGSISIAMRDCFLNNESDETIVQKYRDENKLYKSLYYYQPQAKNADTNIIEPSRKFKAGITEQNKQPEQGTEQGTEQKQILYIQTNGNCIWDADGDGLYDKGFRTLPLIKIQQANRLININGREQEEENPFDFRKYYFFRSIICQYARCIFKEILTDKGLNGPRFVVLNILVPYVFNHKQLQKIKSLLRDDIKKIIESNDLGGDNEKQIKTKQIKAVEIQFVYESDAPALGAIAITGQETQQNLPNGNFLLLDAGKGTLDISIIKFNNKQEFICKYRTGICGAGNALTHAYLCALVADYLNVYGSEHSNNDVKNCIYKFLYESNNEKSKTDIYYIYQMYQAVEDFKKLQERGNAQGEFTPNEKCKGKITDFTEYITKKGNVDPDCFETQEARNYISNCIEFLCYEVINSIKDVILSDERENKIDHIIFAGRAFKCERFKDELTNKLKETNILSPNEPEHEFKYNTTKLNWITEKNVSLCIVLETKNGNYYNIPNMPMIKKKNAPWIPGISDKCFNFIQKLFKQNDKQAEREKWVSIYNIMRNNPLVSSRPNIKLEEEEDLYKYGLHHGFEINFSAVNDKIYYNHYFFHVSGERAVRERIGSGKMKLFIVNGDFYIRKTKKNKNKSRCLKLEFEGYAGEDNLLAKITSFPDITINRAEDVPTITAEELEKQTGQQGNQQTRTNKPTVPAPPEEKNENDNNLANQFL